MSAELISLEQALEQLLALAEQAEPLTSESVAIDEADGRILAQSLISSVDLPPWPNSAMDGYALRLSDWTGAALPVSQRIFAGMQPEPLAPGTCARIFTGAPIPQGADTVEMQENAELDVSGAVRFKQALRQGQHIRPQGQEAHVGDCILALGSRLGPVELGLAASIGVARLRVQRRLRVAVLSTGDELIEPGQALGPGQIYNSNRRLLMAWLKRLGCAVVDAGILKDDLAGTRAALAALSDVDLILSTGGVSVGEADYLGVALRESGQLALWKLAIKPGKPLTVGAYGGVPVIGLPGNPASTLVTFGLLARPYLLRRIGAVDVAPLGFEMPAAFAWPKAGVRREFLRARIEAGCVVPYSNQSSGVLRSAAWAQGLAEIKEGRSFECGELVRFIPFSELMN